MHGGLTETPVNILAEEPEAIADARRFGCSDVEIDHIRRRLAHMESNAWAGDGVWPQNEAIVLAFLSATSQWRTVNVLTETGSYVRFTGLDYTGVRAALEVLEIGVTPELWRGIQVMEATARQELNNAAPGG